MNRAPTGCELQDRQEFVDGDMGVAQNSAERAESDFFVKGNGDRLALRVGGMAKTDVTAFLANRLIAEFRESLNKLLARNDR